ncbi:MAG: rhodoquinone biosynthesis methyltransferase RquA [Xanthomonadales bacterium]|nr:rhodoquinone biosynthesis methyltransferase RquA [Xanthomonadales bacterium]
MSSYAATKNPPTAIQAPPPIPDYLQDTYWWAYLHPKSFYFFEREWVVNLILWGNMKKLTQAVLADMQLDENSRALQVACVYGDFSNRLAAHLNRTNSRLELVDVAAIQLGNVRKKLAGHENVGFHHQDSTSLGFPDDSFDQSVIFFLLHEQPEDARRETIAEAIRVTRPGGKVIFVDYHGPKRSNPMRYVMKPILSWLEPFAMDLWRQELPDFMPADIRPEQVDSRFYFGGLYQKIVLSL